MQAIQEVLTRARTEVRKVIIGQEDVIDKALIAISTGHHALIEGVPGVAKTLLVRTLARVLGCEYNRIQFTPDLMPADITGTNVFNMKLNEFALIKGPVFTTFLLADEINRAPAKTQSALLQAMQERRVTIDRETHSLSPNFTVFATQNPVEYEGTYPLPEAQKDRFMLKVSMSAPIAPRGNCAADACRIRRRKRWAKCSRDQRRRSRADAHRSMRSRARNRRLRRRCRPRQPRNDTVLVGAGRARRRRCCSPAARTPRSPAATFVTPDDVKTMTEPVLGHRLVLRRSMRSKG